MHPPWEDLWQAARGCTLGLGGEWGQQAWGCRSRCKAGGQLACIALWGSQGGSGVKSNGRAEGEAFLLLLEPRHRLSQCSECASPFLEHCMPSLLLVHFDLGAAVCLTSSPRTIQGRKNEAEALACAVYGPRKWQRTHCNGHPLAFIIDPRAINCSGTAWGCYYHLSGIEYEGRAEPGPSLLHAP